MLIKGLPRDALVRTPESERGRDPWTAELELMAQLIEVVSITASGKQLRKPIKVPRPKKDTAKAAASKTKRAASAADDNPYRSAIRMFGGAQPSRIREGQDAGPVHAGSAPVVGGDGSDPSYRSARQMFGGAQPSRLRLVHDEGRADA